MASWHGRIFFHIGKFWENFRRFAFNNRTIFEIFFIFLYAFEQIALVWYAFNSKTENLGYVVSVFAIIVLVTFALHKLLMESRIKVLEDDVKELQLEKFDLESFNKDVLQGYNELRDRLLLQEDLNTYKYSLDKEKRRIK